MRLIRLSRTVSVALAAMLVQCAFGQNSLSPGHSLARSLGAGETDSLSIPLNDGDYVWGSVTHHGHVNVVILNPDASRHGGRLLGPAAEGKVAFTFAADVGQGLYSIVVANPGAQPLAYEVLIEKVVSLDERLGREPWSDTLSSPRIQALRGEIASGQSTDGFWKEMADRGTPLVEPLGSDGKYHLVTFLWRARHDTRNVVVLGSFLDPVSPENLAMHRLGTSDVWYLTAKLPAGARFTYTLSPNDPMTWDDPRAGLRSGTHQVDPLNPHRMLPGWRSCGAAASKYVCINVAELPDASPQPWTISKAGTPRGRVERRSIESKIQRIARPFSVYTPANYKADGQANSLLILFDGPAYVSNDSSGWYDPLSMQTLTTLNELIAAAKIPPTVVVFVNNVGNRRLVDLFANPDFADFVSTELVPWVRANYNVTTNPSRAAVGGYSAGGFAAAYVAFRHPEVFGNVISQSGSFWWAPDHNGGYCDGICRDSGYVAEVKIDGMTEPNWLAKQFLISRKLPVRFDLEAGVFELDRYGKGGDILEPTRAFRDVLLAKGYDVHYQQFVGGHDGLSWRGSIADALIYLLGSHDGAK
jgi:enterochelin esterase-like enzyme